MGHARVRCGILRPGLQWGASNNREVLGANPAGSIAIAGLRYAPVEPVIAEKQAIRGAKAIRKSRQQFSNTPTSCDRTEQG